MTPNAPSVPVNEELHSMRTEMSLETTVNSNLDVEHPVNKSQLSTPQTVDMEDSFQVDSDVSNDCHATS